MKVPDLSGISPPLNVRVVLFVAIAMLLTAFAFGPLSCVVTTGQPPDYFAYIPFIPAISAVLMTQKKRSWLDGQSGSAALGLPILLCGLALCLSERIWAVGLIGQAQLRTGGAILALAGSFLALFGTTRFRRVAFPFLFLMLAIPLPSAWMESFASTLVTASSGLTQSIFEALDVPFINEGSIFYLPGFDIVLAQECSGIRSSLALFITSLLAGHLFLARSWQKIVFALAVFPVAVLKNAVRIVTLYLSGYFVDIRIIQGGFLHRSGGFIFFGLGLAILAGILWWLANRRALIFGRPASLRRPKGP